MKQKLLELYEKAQEPEKRFIEYILQGHPFMGAVSKCPKIENDKDMLFSIVGEQADINMLRACVVSADLALCHEDAFLSELMVASLIMMGWGYSDDDIKEKVAGVLERARSLIENDDSKKILH